MSHRCVGHIFQKCQKSISKKIGFCFAINKLKVATSSYARLKFMMLKKKNRKCKSTRRHSFTLKRTLLQYKPIFCTLSQQNSLESRSNSTVIEKRRVRGRIRNFLLNSDSVTSYLSHTIREVV